MVTPESAGRRKHNALLLMLTVMLALCSGSSSEDAPLLVEDALGIPSPPGNVLATVYSSTDAELSWEAAQDDGWIMGYEIVRDGEPVVALLDALSYYDPELVPDTPYLYLNNAC